MMRWDDLRYVLAITRHRTLHEAARSLGVSHTTAGRRLRALEETLGVRLFDRTPDGLSPTPAGQDMAEEAEAIEARVHALEGRVLGRDARLRGKLRVTTMDMLFHRHHAAFSSFLTRYPDVAVTLLVSDAEVSLTRREADVALRMTGTPPEHLVGRRVGEVSFAVYASEALVARVGEGAPYSAYPWLHWDERLNMRWLDRWLAHHAPGARIAMRVDASALAMKEALRAGIGAHFLATFEGDSDPTLRRVSPDAPDEGAAFTRDLWLLTLPELRHTSRVQAFMDHMADAIRSTR